MLTVGLTTTEDQMPEESSPSSVVGAANLARLLYTPNEAAEVLRISRSKLYELLATGVIRTLRIGASRRIPATALEEFVTSQLAATDPLDPLCGGRGSALGRPR